MTEHGKLPAALLAALLSISVITIVLAPAGPTSWFLEVGPGLVGVAVMVLTYKRAPLSHFVYVGAFIHVLILIYGGMYTYAEAPLGNWFKEAFDLSRNHYDRVGHTALGVFPCFIVKEVLLLNTKLVRGGWLYFIVVSIILAIGAFWELMEWWATLVLASDVGQAFLGSQGDIWDAQWDMFLALLGAMIALPLFGKLHDRSMARIPRPN